MDDEHDAGWIHDTADDDAERAYRLETAKADAVAEHEAALAARDQHDEP